MAYLHALLIKFYVWKKKLFLLCVVGCEWKKIETKQSELYFEISFALHSWNIEQILSLNLDWLIFSIEKCTKMVTEIQDGRQNLNTKVKVISLHSVDNNLGFKTFCTKGKWENNLESQAASSKKNSSQQKI